MRSLRTYREHQYLSVKANKLKKSHNQHRHTRAWNTWGIYRVNKKHFRKGNKETSEKKKSFSHEMLTRDRDEEFVKQCTYLISKLFKRSALSYEEYTKFFPISSLKFNQIKCLLYWWFHILLQFPLNFQVFGLTILFIALAFWAMNSSDGKIC